MRSAAVCLICLSNPLVLVDSFQSPPPSSDRPFHRRKQPEHDAVSPLDAAAAASSPFPTMPSRTFIDLAQNQFELLANSISYPPPLSSPSSSTTSHATHTANGQSPSKIRSIALYLPQENQHTGQLEFVPTALYPSPSSERMFIASEVGSGLPPTMPKTLAKLPGFAHAQSLLPAYPFAGGSILDGKNGGSSPTAVGEAEEVMCDLNSGIRGSALSVPLYSGSRTVGVMLVWPSAPPAPYNDDESNISEECYDPWTDNDKEQITRAARSIAMALSMDADRAEMRARGEDLRIALEDSLHQVKNPLQAMRTYAKVLQRKIALEEDMMDSGEVDAQSGRATRKSRGPDAAALTTPQLLALAENMMVQSDRVVDLLAPMDSIVDALEEQEEKRRLLEGSSKVPLLGPSAPPPDPPGALAFPVTGHGANDTSASHIDGQKSEEQAKQKKKKDDNEEQKTPPAATNESSRNPAATATSSTLGDLEVEIAFVPDVLEPVISASKAVAEERGIKFEVVGMEDDVELPGVSICPKSLQEAVANILENAIKYVTLGKGGRSDSPNLNPHIRLTLAPNHEPYKAGVTILVEDNGPGIPHEEREAVFMRGFRGDATRLVPGSGIGLDISKTMISRMGGILDIVDNGDDESGKRLDGTAVRLVLFRDA